MGDLALTAAGRLDASDPLVRQKQVARQFEQEFVAQILKPMGEANPDDPIGGSDPGDAAFKGMLLDGLAEHAAGGLGIARIIEQEFARRVRHPPTG